MAITLQTLTYYLFQGENLARTMAVLAKDKSSFPSILLYQATDALYLQDWSALSASLPTAAENNLLAQQANRLGGTSPKPKSDNEAVTPQGFVDWLEHTGSKVIGGIEKVGGDIYATAKDVAEIAKDEAQVFYYQSGMAGILQNMPPKEAQEMAETYKDAVSEDFKNFGKDVTHLVTNVVKLATTGAGSPLDLVLKGIGAVLNDPSLSVDYEHMLDSVADALGTLIGSSLELVGDVATRLNTDAIILIADAIVVVATAGTHGTGAAFINDWKFIGRDIVISLLETVVIGLGAIKTIIKDLIQAVGYLIKLMTDAIIDLGAGVAAVLNPAAWLQAGGVANYYHQYQAELDTHKELISQMVTVGLLVGVTIATGGTGVWLAVGLGATLAFGSFMIMSGAQQDTEIADVKQEIAQYLDTFTIWTRNQEIVGTFMQSSLVEEVKEELNAEISNKQIGLGFYENYFNETFRVFGEQQSMALGAYQKQLLKKDAYGMIADDVGTMYGHITGWLNWNPSQGLALYEPCRGHFAQEIAQIPATFTSTDQATGQQMSVPRFWFLQSLTKDFERSPASALVFEARLRPLYLLDQFYVGIGIGGVPVDAQAIAQYKGTIDRYNHAKMIIVKKEQAGKPPSLGVYEHEVGSGKAGWVASQQAPAFTPGTWYRFRATLQGSSLGIQVWPEGDSAPSPTTVHVTPLPSVDVQKRPITRVPFSVIFSGASIEFDCVNPDERKAITAVSSIYTGGPSSTEVAREKVQQATYEQISKPTFNKISDLAPASPSELIKGHYIYTTQQTNIDEASQHKVTTDYVAFAALAQEPAQATSIGMSPLGILGTPPNALVSLVTNKVVSGQAPFYQNAMWSQYVSQNQAAQSPVGPTLIARIDDARHAYATSLMGQQTVGAFTVTGVSLEAMLAGQYVYATMINNLPDYVIMATLDDQNFVTLYGMPYDPSNKQIINGLVSLVTTQIYTLKSTMPTSNLVSNAITLFTDTYGNLLPDIQAMITKAAAAQKKAAGTPQPTKPATGAPTTPTNISHTGAPSYGSAVPAIGQSSGSLNQQQQDASSDTGWG